MYVCIYNIYVYIYIYIAYPNQDWSPHISAEHRIAHGITMIWFLPTRRDHLDIPCFSSFTSLFTAANGYIEWCLMYTYIYIHTNIYIYIYISYLQKPSYFVMNSQSLGPISSWGHGWVFLRFSLWVFRRRQGIQIPGAGPEWRHAAPIFVTSVKSDEAPMHGRARLLAVLAIWPMKTIGKP